MKKVLLNVSIVLVSMLISTSAFSNLSNPYNVNVLTTTESKKLVVNLSHMYGSSVTCSIIDQSGNIIHREKVESSTQTIKRYDLSNLKPGNYTVVIDDLMTIEKLKVKLTADEIIYSQNRSEIIYKPTIIVKDNAMVYLNLLALGRPVKISVIKGDSLIYSEETKDEGSVLRKYTFAESPAGEYIIKVKVGDEVFFNTVNI